MDSSKNDLIHDYHPLFRIYKDGRIERFPVTDFVPPSDDPETGVRSKDTVISSETNVSARIFLPISQTTIPNRKLPVLVYIHGGAFCIQSPFSSFYHHYLNTLVAEANVIAVSIDYRLAPEHPIPACYDDSWTVMKWVASHANSNEDGRGGAEPWLNDHADLERIFLAGDSAGANIAHDIAVRVGGDGLGPGVKLVGMVLVHPYFGNKNPEKLWMLICPDTSGWDDPRFNPAVHRSLLSKLGCGKVLVATAEKDTLRGRGWRYYQALKDSGWDGAVEITETQGEGHVFHLFDPECEKARVLMKRVASFINESPVRSLM